MHVTMIKKRLENGEPCKKCLQAEEVLRSRGLWERIDEVVWAAEGEPESPGMRLAAEHHIDLAPFFIVKDDAGKTRIYDSVIKLMREALNPPAAPIASAPAVDQLSGVAADYAERHPSEIVRWALERFGQECAIAFSGAEDVVLIDMAAKTGLP